LDGAPLLVGNSCNAYKNVPTQYSYLAVTGILGVLTGYTDPQDKCDLTVLANITAA